MWLESRVVDGEVGLTVDSSLFLFVCLVRLVINYIECCPRSIPIKLKISVTNNFGFNVHNDSHGDTLLSFIENKHRAILHEELKICRNPNLQDNRLHLGLYFINANVKG